MKKPELPEGFKPPFKIKHHPSGWSSIEHEGWKNTDWDIARTGLAEDMAQLNVQCYALNLAYPVKKRRKP